MRAIPWLLLVFVLAAGICFAAESTPKKQEDAAPNAAGIWVSEGGQSRVEIVVKDDGTLSGKIVWLREPLYGKGEEPEGQPKTDQNNPDAARHGDPIIGLEILKGFEREKNGEWKGGTVYDPETGKTYKAKISMKDADTLNLRGFIGISLLGRTTEWKRYVPEPGDAAAGDNK
mgnify:CR=1 FL=1